MVDSTCEICLVNERKYTCPKCSKKTCSVGCIKTHKSQDNCSGMTADPTGYVPRQKLKEADTPDETNVLVHRDYNFLLGMNRKVELLKRDGKTSNKRVLSAHHHGQHAQKRGHFEQPPKVIRRGVHCVLLPRGMQRSLQNKSKWDKSLDSFVWSIEWCLFAPDGTIEYTQTSHRNKETDSLFDCIGKSVYEKCHSLNGLEPVPEGSTKQTRIESLAASDLKFYMKQLSHAMETFADSKKLIPIDPTKSIAESFRDKTVIEYPTIFIAKNGQSMKCGYSVLGEGSESSSSESESSDSSSADSDSDEDSSSSGEESSNSDDDEPPETTSKQPPVYQSIKEPQVEEDDEDDYTPGISLDFLAD